MRPELHLKSELGFQGSPGVQGYGEGGGDLRIVPPSQLPLSSPPRVPGVIKDPQAGLCSIRACPCCELGPCKLVKVGSDARTGLCLRGFRDGSGHRGTRDDKGRGAPPCVQGTVPKA